MQQYKKETGTSEIVSCGIIEYIDVLSTTIHTVSSTITLVKSINCVY